MLIVVAVAMLRAAMLVLVAVLIVSATLHPQDQDKPPSPPAATPVQRVREQKKPAAKQVNMCMHVCAFVCMCMLAAVLMMTVMQRQQKHKSPTSAAPEGSNKEREEAGKEVSNPVCAGMHVHA